MACRRRRGCARGPRRLCAPEPRGGHAPPRRADAGRVPEHARAEAGRAVLRRPRRRARPVTRIKPPPVLAGGCCLLYFVVAAMFTLCELLCFTFLARVLRGWLEGP